MLKLVELKLNHDILSMKVLIEGDVNRAYGLSVKISDGYAVVCSEIPLEHKIYERQARTALRKYDPHKLPETISAMWY